MNVLTINSGSSSLKFSLYQINDEKEVLELNGELSDIGMKKGTFAVYNGKGKQIREKELEIRDHNDSLKLLFDFLKKHSPEKSIDAVGHRIVHGGAEFRKPILLTDEDISKLEDLIPLAPEHLPHEIKAVKIVMDQFPDLNQTACFDTGFHRHMPEKAQNYPLPLKMRNEGICRYGFHGLSYEYIMQELEKEAGSEISKGRIIIAHLGNGASMAAVKDGKSQDTTMGFTPAGGLIMGTRSGDLDPGVIIYLQNEKKLSVDEINKLVNENSGLIGISGESSDMKELLESENGNDRVKLAIDMFCYQAGKYIGALTAVLGGLDTMIFTGGIGENSSEIRQRICQNLDYLGIELNDEKNKENEKIISENESEVTVRVMKTNEELMISRHSYGILKESKLGEKLNEKN